VCLHLGLAVVLVVILALQGLFVQIVEEVLVQVLELLVLLLLVVLKLHHLAELQYFYQIEEEVFVVKHHHLAEAQPLQALLEAEMWVSVLKPPVFVLAHSLGTQSYTSGNNSRRHGGGCGLVHSLILTSNMFFLSPIARVSCCGSAGSATCISLVHW
jgi:hypothetical protein